VIERTRTDATNRRDEIRLRIGPYLVAKVLGQNIREPACIGVQLYRRQEDESAPIEKLKQAIDVPEEFQRRFVQIV
jgi:hypothetical protein